MKYLSLAVLILSCVSCQQSADQQSVFGAEKARIRVRLADGPTDKVQKVLVNVEHIEMLVEKEGELQALIIGKKLGMVDLMGLRGGLSLPIAKLSLDEGTALKEVRLVLRAGSHHLIRHDGSHCEMKTSSENQPGLKVELKDAKYLKAHSEYVVNLDLDIPASIMKNNSGECFFGPFLKVGPIVRENFSSDEDWDEEDLVAEETIDEELTL